ncbi:hypothetical protein O181_023425 [Austropuccinia psidii MF-1]|uniref:Uncharacterized protein n=1 Tax=Austropuccinia psidii MF-1 TaxID=1389203 RepID=A0A9Q3CIG7_9BASI|nr:hypothetical protein [Austropuccinia psidii MF-1]
MSLFSLQCIKASTAATSYVVKGETLIEKAFGINWYDQILRREENAAIIPLSSVDLLPPELYGLKMLRKAFHAKHLQMFSYFFICLTVFLQLSSIHSLVRITNKYVCLNDTGVGLLYIWGRYTNLGNDVNNVPDGKCSCSSDLTFSCTQFPTGSNQLPQGQLTCGTEFGCAHELKNTKSICTASIKVGALQRDGSVLGPGSVKADGKCECDQEMKLQCTQPPTGANKLPNFGHKTCVADTTCPNVL